MNPIYLVNNRDELSFSNRALIYLHVGQSNVGDSLAIANAPGYLTGGAVSGVFIADRNMTGFDPFQIGVNNNVYTSHTTYGPTGELGYRLNATLGESIYILKLGVGGSALDGDRQPPTGVDSWDTAVVGELADEMVTMIEWAKTQDFGGNVPVFAGMLINQGEADAGAVPETPDYIYKLRSLIQVFRVATGNMTMPVIYAGLNPTSYGSSSLYTDVQTLAAQDSSFFYLSSNLWGYQGDNVHLDAAGIASCGSEAASIFSNLLMS